MSNLRNLYEETVNTLEYYDKDWNDVIGICGDNIRIPLQNFKKMANKTYDSGFGLAEVPRDLKIVGEDWWFERAEYDGAEWWEFKKIPDVYNLPLEKEEFNLFNSISTGERTLRECWRDRDDEI